MIKRAYIKQIFPGKWRVFSEGGKNLGTYNSKPAAEKRLKQIEMFKHMKNKRKKALQDLYLIVKKSNIEPFYSFIMRDKNKENKEDLISFMKNFKQLFDQAILNGQENPEISVMEELYAG